MRIIKLIIAFAAALVGFSAQADFELGFKYYQEQNFPKALKEFHYAANIGDQDAQMNIGVMHFRGEGVAKSNSKAYAWLKLANTPETEKKSKTFNAVLKKLSAEEIAQGEKEFERLQPLMAAAVNAQLMPRLTQQQTTTGPKLLKSAKLKYPGSALEAGSIGIQQISFTVAKDGTARDFVLINKVTALDDASLEALRQFQFQPAQVQGRPINTYNEDIRMKFMITNESVDISKIKRLLNNQRELADKGDAQNMFIYGAQSMLYQSYLHDLKDKKAGELEFDNPNTWFYKAALKGNATAAFFVGSNMLAGNYCEQDIDRGAAWLERAATQGSPDAQFILGSYYFEGTLVPKDEEKGIFWLQKATLSGYANAALRLSRIYATAGSDTWFKPRDAQLVFNTVKDNHLDKLTYFEVKAAVAAANGDYKSAITAQKKAQDLAQQYNLNIPAQQQALIKYQQNQPWSEI